MSSYLCISIRFADPTFRGRGDEGEPEWPPSPLRVFQALVAASAARFGDADRFRDYAVPAFGWFGSLGPPLVIAPASTNGTPFRLAVPNNDMDIVAEGWSKRTEPRKQPAELKTLKTVRPTHIVGGEEFPGVYFLWAVADEQKAECEKHKEALFAAARSVVALGWGVDMAVGHGQILDDAGVRTLKGERWQPVPVGGSTRLRVPVAGTFDALVNRHRAFLNRLPATGGFVPVPPLTAFDVVGYARDTDPVARPLAAFELHKPVAKLANLETGKSRFRPFDAVRTPGFARREGGGGPCGAVVVAGLVRHATAKVACQIGWPEKRINSFILGHGDKKNGQATTDDRLMFLPLPSITPLKVESIRRVLVVGPPGSDSDLARLRQLLNGSELVPEGQTDDNPVAMLSVMSQADRNVRVYTDSSRVWSTITPVALPGFDDPNGIRRRLREKDPAKVMTESEKKNQLAALENRIQGLLRKAFEHAGMRAGLLDDAVIEWRDVGFRPGVELSGRYALDPLKYPRYHVRVRFAQSIRGPLAIGAGRYRGLGLFAAESG